jgi:hypothetical protein
MAGVDLTTVKELMGHKTIAMTLRYSHLSPGHQRQAVERLVGAGSSTGSSTAVEVAPSTVAVNAPNHATINTYGGLASTGKAVDLKSTGPRGPWGFESLALRHSFDLPGRPSLAARVSPAGLC